MAAKRRSTRRKSSAGSAPGPGMILLVLVVLVGGVAGGYAWRSYAPLPLPYPLSDGEPEITRPQGALLEREARDAQSRLRSTEEELNILRSRLREVEQTQVQAEEELADIQIRSILTN